jgi:rhamnosyltransferase subunit B
MIGSRPIPRWMPLAWRRALWRFIDRHWIDNALLPAVNHARAARGMAPVVHFFEHLGARCDASIGLFPSWFAPPVPDWPAPFIEAGFPLGPTGGAAPLPAEIDRFLATGAPPVVVTFGTGMRHAGATFDSALRALRVLGRRGLFVSRHRAQIPRDLPPDVLWVPFAPFETLLPRVAAIVHHGGIGTAAQALRAGIAQLVVASGFDQFDNGARLRALGVGDVLRAAGASDRRLRRRLQTVLASTPVRDACATVARRLGDAGSTPVFLDQVEAAIASVRTPA